MNALKARNRELEKENADTSNKYLRLYDENDKLQEVLQNLQYQLTSGTGAKVSNQSLMNAFGTISHLNLRSQPSN